MPRVRPNSVLPSAAVDAPSPSLAVGSQNESYKPKVVEPSTTGDTVVIACKFPAGVRLQLYKDGEVPSGLRGEAGQKLVPGKLPVGPPVVVHGPRYHIGGSPHCEIIGGWALTRGVRRDFWMQWVQDNSKLQLVTEGLIRAFDTIEDARIECRRDRNIKTGMEPLAPLEGDKRIKSITDKNLGVEVTPGEDRTHEFVEDVAYDS